MKTAAPLLCHPTRDTRSSLAPRVAVEDLSRAAALAGRLADETMRYGTGRDKSPRSGLRSEWRRLQRRYSRRRRGASEEREKRRLPCPTGPLAGVGTCNGGRAHQPGNVTFIFLGSNSTCTCDDSLNTSVAPSDLAMRVVSEFAPATSSAKPVRCLPNLGSATRAMDSQ